MVSLLDKEPVRRAALRVSVDQYHAMTAAGVISERTELLRGVIVEKMSKSPLHTFISQILRDAILACLPLHHCLRQEQPLGLTDSEPDPDLAVVQGSPQDYITQHPAGAKLVIEVAVSSEDLDREKAAIYAAAGIPEFWLVLPAERAVEIHRKPVGETYQESFRLADTSTLSSPCLPGLELPVKAILPARPGL